MKTSSILAVFFGMAATALFTVLVWQRVIGSAAYVTLIAIAALTAFVTHGFSRLKQLDLKNLKLTLDKMEAVKRDIYAKEHDLKMATTVFARLILFNSNWVGIAGSEEFFALRDRWTQMRTDELLASLRIPKNEIDDVCWYHSTLKHLQGLNREDPKRKEEWEGIMTRLKQDCSKKPRR